MQRRHTDRAYESELAEVRARLLHMAGHVEEMIAQSMRALVEADAARARRTIEIDHKVNRLEIETDELCMVILARRQPMATDLRFLTLALKMVTDLERIGDIAVNICERAILLSGMPALKPWVDIPAMSDLTQAMIHDAIDAFVRGDVALAQQVIARDGQVDDLYDKVFADVLDLMSRDHDIIARGVQVLAVAKWLERMADHGTNLAEHVVFLVQGKDLRHQGKLDDAAGSSQSSDG